MLAVSPLSAAGAAVSRGPGGRSALQPRRGRAQGGGADLHRGEGGGARGGGWWVGVAGSCSSPSPCPGGGGDQQSPGQDRRSVEEQLALSVLHHWDEQPRSAVIGGDLVT